MESETLSFCWVGSQDCVYFSVFLLLALYVSLSLSHTHILSINIYIYISLYISLSLLSLTHLLSPYFLLVLISFPSLYSPCISISHLCWVGSQNCVCALYFSLLLLLALYVSLSHTHSLSLSMYIYIYIPLSLLSLTHLLSQFFLLVLISFPSLYELTTWPCQHLNPFSFSKASGAKIPLFWGGGG